jgi:hypothetical protein
MRRAYQSFTWRSVAAQIADVYEAAMQSVQETDVIYSAAMQSASPQSQVAG